MFVVKNIGPVIIGKQVHRFVIGDKLSKDVLDFFEKSEQLEILKKNGVISESLRSVEGGQSGDPNQTGRVESPDDDNKPAENSSGANKRSDKGKGN